MTPTWCNVEGIKGRFSFIESSNLVSSASISLIDWNYMDDRFCYQLTLCLKGWAICCVMQTSSRNFYSRNNFCLHHTFFYKQDVWILTVSTTHLFQNFLQEFQQGFLQELQWSFLDICNSVMSFSTRLLLYCNIFWFYIWNFYSELLNINLTQSLTDAYHSVF